MSEKYTEECTWCNKKFKNISRHKCKSQSATKLEILSEFHSLSIHDNHDVKDERTERTAEDVRQQKLDKFYTNPDIALLCMERVKTHVSFHEFTNIIEPSAGNGSFTKLIQKELERGVEREKGKKPFLHFYDIEPENSPDTPNEYKINKQDFLTVIRPTSRQSNMITIGNPPFGKNSSLAIQFFNHAASFSNIIAFIIPKTFRKTSVQNRLHSNFHLIDDMDIPSSPCSFTPKMNVKCCFQIWEKRDVLRPKVELPLEHPDWLFMKYGPLDKNNQPTPPEGADFAIRAYGGKCGEIVEIGLETLRPKSWHFIIASKRSKEELIIRFKQLNYEDSMNTARQNSIGRAELVKLYMDQFEE